MHQFIKPRKLCNSCGIASMPEALYLSPSICSFRFHPTGWGRAKHSSHLLIMLSGEEVVQPGNAIPRRATNLPTEPRSTGQGEEDDATNHPPGQHPANPGHPATPTHPQAASGVGIGAIRPTPNERGRRKTTNKLIINWLL